MFELTSEGIRDYLEKVLASRGFARNHRLSRFLRLAVEWHLQGRDHELKESVIGTEIFGRKPDYDPKSDGVVRTEARRLRALLNEYYLSDGQQDELIIELPKGGYAPLIRTREAVITPGVPAHPPRWQRGWLSVASVCAILALAAVLSTRLLGSRNPITIAVLPLVDMNSVPDSDYFADGLTSELISNLCLIQGLSVRSQTSSFMFKGRPRNVRDAGAQLDVEYILEGSVLRESGRLRVLVQLVRVRDDRPVWAGRYDRDDSRILAIQDEISRGIVNNFAIETWTGPLALRDQP